MLNAINASSSIPAQPDPFVSPTARFWSYLIDGALIYAAQLGGIFLGGVLAVLMTDPEAPKRVAEDAAAVGMFLGLIFWTIVAWFLNYGILQGLTGGTVGKLILSSRVLNKDGRSIGIFRSLARTFCYFFSALPFGIGFMAIFWTKNKQCLHDSICGTVVVKKDATYPIPLRTSQGDLNELLLEKPDLPRVA